VFCIGAHIELNPLGEEILSTLAPLVHLDTTHAEARALSALVAAVGDELSRAQIGTGFATDQLAKLLFLEVLRIHLRDPSRLSAGRLRAIADPRLTAPIRLMHARPGYDWCLQELACSAGMSRSTFAARFGEAAGVPPLTYLTNWRMELAKRALADRNVSVDEIARTVGYASESAFSHAFKRVIGSTPTAHRAYTRGRAASSHRFPPSIQIGSSR
jgi:transcriptional regulator GlxA family with amidase domain